MLRVNVESKLKNIFIVGNAIYFEDDKGMITANPCNRYMEGTDSYEASEMFLFNEEYLNFNDAAEVESFMDYCIRQYHNDIYIFTYKSLGVVMDFIEDPEVATEDDLKTFLKTVCVK